VFNVVIRLKNVFVFVHFVANAINVNVPCLMLLLVASSKIGNIALLIFDGRLDPT